MEQVIYYHPLPIIMFDLYVVTDQSLSKGRSNPDIARMAYEGGADAVQLRMKGATHEEMLKEALEIRDIAEEYSAFFIVNDDVSIAKESEADGVHLGQCDMPISEAREILGGAAIIGASVTNLEEALKAQKEGADYVGVGSIFSTSTKTDAKQSLGLDVLYEICQNLDIPVIAIGGINQGNIKDVIKAGADGAAVVSAVVSKDDVTKAAHDLRDLVLKARL